MTDRDRDKPDPESDARVAALTAARRAELVAEGEFTPDDLERLAHRASQAELERLNTVRLAQRRRKAVELGEVRAEAERIGVAWRDPEFVAATRAVDRATSALAEADRGLRRCGSRYGFGGRKTELAEQREYEKRAAERALQEARKAFDVARERHGLQDPAEGSYVGSSREGALQNRLRSLLEDLRVEQAEERLREAEARVAEARAELEVASTREIRPERLRAFARSVDEAALKALIRCVVQGYRPKDATIARDPEWGELAAAGLINRDGYAPDRGYRRCANPSGLGRAVARWAVENLAGFGPDVQERSAPAMRRDEFLEAGFTEAQVRDMVRRGTEFLRELGARRLHERHLVGPRELGIPGLASYVILPDLGAVQNFLWVLGASRERKRAVVVGRKPVAPFVPGKVQQVQGVTA